MELGSEFNLSLSNLTIQENNVFAYLSRIATTWFFDCGRSAIKYCVGYLAKGDKVLLPEYICASVIDCFINQEVEFYCVNQDMTLDIDDIKSKITHNTKIVYLMHYFGVIQPPHVLAEMKTIRYQYNVVIFEDMTHGIFSKEKTIGDYVFSSIRKWCPVPGCGALSVVNNSLSIKEPNCAKSVNNYKAEGMILKDMFLKNILECNSIYRRIFEIAENEFYFQTKPQRMSDLSEFILRCFNPDQITQKRRKNFIYLEKSLKDIGLFPINKIQKGESPLAYVIRVKNRDEFRKFLSERKIYCAVHWPFDGICAENRENAIRYSETFISLPIDQRYSKDHMDYLIYTIFQYRGSLSL